MGLMPLISFTKGCYVGQEVIARLDTYDKVQRRLVGLKCDALLTPDDALTDGDRAAGRVTSVAESFSMDAPVALGIVRKDWAEPGTRLESPSGQVTVAELPFV
jgi:folate-binding Fe-S cluster repair protein YgfZ